MLGPSQVTRGCLLEHPRCPPFPAGPSAAGGGPPTRQLPPVAAPTAEGRARPGDVLPAAPHCLHPRPFPLQGGWLCSPASGHTPALALGPAGRPLPGGAPSNKAELIVGLLLLSGSGRPCTSLINSLSAHLPSPGLGGGGVGWGAEQTGTSILSSQLKLKPGQGQGAAHTAPGGGSRSAGASGGLPPGLPSVQPSATRAHPFQVTEPSLAPPPLLLWGPGPALARACGGWCLGCASLLCPRASQLCPNLSFSSGSSPEPAVSKALAGTGRTDVTGPCPLEPEAL